jgi:nucleoside diphosphate kinase
MNFKTDHLSLTGDTEDIQFLQNDNKLAELALHFPNVNSLLIPKKVEYNLRKYAPKGMLRAIDSNVDVAVEKCLVFLSNLSSTYYTEDNWKSLSSEILHQQTKSKDSTYIYSKINKALKHGTSKGSIIEVNGSYQAGQYCKKYRLTDTYLKAGLVEYTIKDTGIIQNRNKLFYEQLNEAMENPICSNLIKMYTKIDLPTSKELLVIGKRLVKQGYRIKKGKLLTMRNGHKDSYWKDSKNRSFVEDNIKLYEFLTSRGFMIPSVGDDKSGGRVVDTFTLMPAWIRDQITVDGLKLVECDYTALHPNIAIKLYNGKESYLTHQNVAERIGIDVRSIKIEHLSFFNKRWQGMLKSPLFNFYSELEADMLSRIYIDKKDNGYKVTSAKMFKAEVSIMTDVIKHLNSIEINVLYVYDALLCEEKDKTMVIETMNRVILNHGVKTKVKNN